MKKLISIVLILAVSTSCQNPSKPDERIVTDVSSVEAPSTQPSIALPVGDSPWQPADTPIVIHTAMESWETYPRLIETSQLRHKSAFQVKFRSSSRGESENIIPKRPETQTLVAFDTPELRVGGALHFFEVRGKYFGRNEHLEQTDALWLLEDDVAVYSPTESNELTWFIRKLEGYEPLRTGMPERSGDPDELDVKEPYRSFATRCQNNCEIPVYVWRPELDSIQVLPTTAQFMPKSERPDRGPFLPTIHVKTIPQ